MDFWSFLALAVLAGCAVGVTAVVLDSPVGKALAERIRKKGALERPPAEPPSPGQEELDALTTQIILMRQELNELKRALPPPPEERKGP